MATPATGLWGAVQWLRMTKETTPGAYPSSPTDTSPASDSVVQWISLESGAAFTMEPSPIRQVVKSAGSRNMSAYQVAQRVAYKGKLVLNLPQEQAVFLVEWATTFTGDNDNVMQSMSLDWNDGNEVRRYVGAIVDEITFDSDADKDYVVVSISITAQKQDASLTTLAEPVYTKFPVLRRFCHQDSAGLVTASGTIVGYKKLGVTIKNKVFYPFNESKYVQVPALYCGRDISWNVSRLNISADTREAFEEQTALTSSQVQYQIVGTATATVTFNFGSANYISGRNVDRSFDASQYEDLTTEPFFTSALGSNATITATYV